MFDVCKFVNSKDVAAHLRDIGYEFTVPEAALVVYLSLGATLDEKVGAWLEMAESMPDCSMGGRRNMRPIPSFRRFLRDYASLKEREVERFFEPDGCVYCYSYYEAGLGWQDDGNPFSSAQKCLEHARAYWADDCWNEDDAPREFRVSRKPVDRPDSGQGGELRLNRDFEITSVCCAEGDEEDASLGLQFEGMWFAIPTPFKRGDIVRDSRFPDRGPFVLDWLPGWGRAELLAGGFREEGQIVERADWRLQHWSRDGDVSDMSCAGFGMTESGDVYTDGGMGIIYLDLERVDGSLGGRDRWAEVWSAYLKREIGADEAQNLLRYLQADDEARKLRRCYDGRYDEKYYADGVWQRMRREEG